MSRGQAGPGRLRLLVARAIQTHHLWAPGQAVAVAVSGGRDSVCLLDLLVQTRGLHKAELSVVTVDHGTRPGASADADFVEGLAAAQGLPCHRARLSLKGASEATLRAARRGVFAGLSVQAVATGHHQQDQAETVLLQLIRGAGTRGMGGMRWRHQGVVRPLLGCSVEALQAYAIARGLRWREDPSNRDPRYLRNRVREELLPVIRSLRPGAIPRLAAGAEHAAEDDAWIRAQLAEVPEAQRRSVAWLSGAPAPLTRRALGEMWPGLGQSHVDALIRLARGQGRHVQLPGGGVARCRQGTLYFDKGG